MMIGSAVVVAGAVGFGVDQLVSSSNPSKPHNIRGASPSTTNPSGSTNSTAPTSTPPPTIAHGLASTYLATSSDALVSIDWSSTSTGLNGTATVVAATGHPPDRGEDFVTYTVHARLGGSELSVSFNGASPTTASVNGDSIAMDVHLPTGATEHLLFHSATAAQIVTARAAFIRSLESAPSSRTKPTT